MARASHVEKRARALVLELARVTEGRPQQWRMLQDLEQRLGFDQAAMTAAVLEAAKRGWIAVDPLAAKGKAPPHSISLTEEGRQALKAKN